MNALKGLLSDLPRDREIVAYCRGPYCVLSVQAVEMLREQGFSAVRLEEGVQDWRALGFPVPLAKTRFEPMTIAIRSYLIPVLAVVLTVGFLWHSQRPSPPGPSNLVQVEQEAKRGSIVNQHGRTVETSSV